MCHSDKGTSPYGLRVGRCDMPGSRPQDRRNSPDVSVRTRIASTEFGERSDNLSRQCRESRLHSTIDPADPCNPDRKIAACSDVHTNIPCAPMNIFNYNFRAFRVNFKYRFFNLLFFNIETPISLNRKPIRFN